MAVSVPRIINPSPETVVSSATLPDPAIGAVVAGSVTPMASAATIVASMPVTARPEYRRRRPAVRPRAARAP
ncbi:hypothetical protein ACWEN6_04180 [Sphaerisporangium sp. NPDC004334]